MRRTLHVVVIPRCRFSSSRTFCCFIPACTQASTQAKIPNAKRALLLSSRFPTVLVDNMSKHKHTEELIGGFFFASLRDTGLINSRSSAHLLFIATVSYTDWKLVKLGPASLLRPLPISALLLCLTRLLSRLISPFICGAHLRRPHTNARTLIRTRSPNSYDSLPALLPSPSHPSCHQFLLSNSQAHV